jgi:NADPH-dependent 2,4-dienoyl-CoA reductase/sulfur reductase-like enzyme
MARCAPCGQISQDGCTLAPATEAIDRWRCRKATEAKMTSSDVLIIGAGPTGLVLALWLVQARTLELYRQLDLTDTVVAHGNKVPAVNLWAPRR